MAFLSVVFATPARSDSGDVAKQVCSLPLMDQICDTAIAVSKTADFVSDPLGYLAHALANAVASVLTSLAEDMDVTQVDWSNEGFVRTYTMAFGASVILTVVLWLIAVAKRAIQGVPPLQALGESIGFLLMSVMASAFAPLVVAYATELFDSVADAMLKPVAGDVGRAAPVILAALLVLMAMGPAGGAILLMIGAFLLLAILGVWLEIIVRNALIYAGLVFGPTVFAGLVDRNLWGHSKRWAGVLVGIIASKYVTFTTLALASGLLVGNKSQKASVLQAFGTSLTALALFWLALFLPFQVAKFVPILGDQLQEVFSSRKQLQGGVSSGADSAQSTYGELKSRLGPKKPDKKDEGEGANEAADSKTADAGASTAEGAGAATAAGGVAMGKAADNVEASAMRSVDAAVAATSPNETPDNEEAAPLAAAGEGNGQSVTGTATPSREPSSRERPDAVTAEPDASSPAAPDRSIPPSVAAADSSPTGGPASPPPAGGVPAPPPTRPSVAPAPPASVPVAPAAPGPESATWSDGSPLEEPPDVDET
ncbi:hypothetical protein [Kitasatospora aureofaciens]|uniref:hypothetical protein n=1 Tax=Kitasatospora aureofaciens TaxID=1894 RepID=UPI00131DD2B3|nr:hypothetical protein [Kitasatospora aureofaciens]